MARSRWRAGKQPVKALGHVAARRAPTVAIALGGGGARGIAHVLALEALDEMEIKPAAIAGASMGAVVGAAYAAGIEARDIRAHVLRVLRNRSDVMAKLLRARVGRFADIVLRGRGNPVLLDAELFLDLFWPADMPVSFEALEISHSRRRDGLLRARRDRVHGWASGTGSRGFDGNPRAFSSRRERRACSHRRWGGKSASLRPVV